jgi:hypothetical protein
MGNSPTLCRPFLEGARFEEPRLTSGPVVLQCIGPLTAAATMHRTKVAQGHGRCIRRALLSPAPFFSAGDEYIPGAGKFSRLRIFLWSLP